MIFRFLEFQLDARRFELRRGAERLPAARGNLDALLYLVRHRDRVISRGEMMRQLWPDVVVQERVVDQTIYTTRKLLADDARAPRAIETSRGRGWRFIAQVVETARARERIGAWPAGDAPFVRRRTELERLNAALEAASEGRGALFIVHGAPGLGKSRLLAEFGARARLLGFAHHAARCAGEGAPRFAPWLQLLRAQRERAGGGGLRVMLARTSRFAELSVERAAQAWCAQSTGASFAQRHAFFSALAEFWRDAAARLGPLLLVLDDLHRADPLTLDFLNHLAPEVSAMSMLVLASARPENFGVLRFAGATHLQLGGFDAQECRAFAEGLWERAPSDAELAQLRERSAGNPYWLTQFASHLDAPPRPGARLPVALRAAGLAPLANAPPEWALLLQCAAVIGVRFSVDELCALAERPRASVLEQLEAACAEGLLTPPLTRGAPFRFQHALLRDALYETLGVARREELHEKLTRKRGR